MPLLKKIDSGSKKGLDQDGYSKACGLAAIVSFPPILFKNSVFGEINEIIRRTAQSAFWGEGFGLTGLPPLMRQLSLVPERFHLTSRHHWLLSEICDI